MGANLDAARFSGIADLKMLPDNSIDDLFFATAEATEEATINAMVGAETMTGANHQTVVALRMKSYVRRSRNTTAFNNFPLVITDRD